MSLTQHTAPGASAGLIYQFQRALYWLSKSPAGFRVGIETCDDVSIQEEDGSQTYEQDKHSIQENAKPFGDRSVDLWKTLAIWLEAIDEGEIDIKNANFLMVTNKILPECIARTIGQAADEASASECIALLEQASKEPPATTAPYMNRVLRSESRENLMSLIIKCELSDGSQSSNNSALQDSIRKQLPIPSSCTDQAESIVDELLGWIVKSAMEMWLKGEPAWISRDNFVNQLHAIIISRRRKITRERAEHLIAVPDEKVESEKGFPYVRQLHLVTDNEDIVDDAIRECVRCGIEKGRLSEEGNITDEDWKTFESTLLARWKKVRARILNIPGQHTEQQNGCAILMDTTGTYRERLAGEETDQIYLTAGTYHRMANSIDLGWHPRYEELMQKDNENHE